MRIVEIASFTFASDETAERQYIASVRWLDILCNAAFCFFDPSPLSTHLNPSCKPSFLAFEKTSQESKFRSLFPGTPLPVLFHREITRQNLRETRNADTQTCLHNSPCFKKLYTITVILITTIIFSLYQLPDNSNCILVSYGAHV